MPNGNSTGVPFHRLYVGNIHFSITESDLRNVFEPFGELEFVQLQKDETGRSRGYGFVQYVTTPLILFSASRRIRAANTDLDSVTATRRAKHWRR